MGKQEHWASERRRGRAGPGIDVVDGLAAAVVVVFALVFAATSATGATITIPNGADFTVYNVYGGVDPAVAGDTIVSVGNFEPFDTSLGTLTAVSFEIAAMGGAALMLSGLSPGEYGAVLGAYESFGIVGENQLWSTDFIALGLLLSATVAADGSVGPHWSTDVPYEIEFWDGNSLGFQYPTITENLDLFTVAGTQFVGAVRYEWLARWPDGSQSVVPATTAAGAIAVAPYGSVTYEYTPIPQPSTALLVGIGLAAISAHRSRRNT